MLRSIVSVLKKKRKATVGRIRRKNEGFKPGMKESGVMDDESGESMKPVEEVPVKELGESELKRLVRG